MGKEEERPINLEHHSLFKNASSITSKADIISDRLTRFGDRIILDIKLSDIEVRPQVRKSFNLDRIKTLSEDIKDKGLIHPVTVMVNPDKEGHYILLVGGNRYEAYKLLGREEIPCIVKAFTDDDVEIKLIQLAENMHRTDINPVELSDALMELKRKTNYTLAQIAKAVGRNIDSIKQYSRISKLSNEEKSYHIGHGSTKNEILSYLAQKKKLSPQKPKKRPVLVTPQKIELPKLTLWKEGQYKDSKDSLAEKIKAAETFLAEAKKLLDND